MSNTIKAIHATRRQVPGLGDDDTWRDFLHRITGERSIRAMSEEARQQVLTTLRRRAPRTPATFKPSDKLHVRKVFAIWGAMCRSGIPDNPTRAGLRAFVAKMTVTGERPEGVGNPEWLALEEAAKITEALKAWQRRELAKRKAAR